MRNRRFRAAVFLAVALFAGAAGFYLNRASLPSPVVESAAQKMMLTALPDPNGTVQVMSQWRGKVLVVNFWATWCAPCREEIPALVRAQNKYGANGVQFVGIALDNASKVRDFAEEMRINYTLLIGGTETLSVTKDLGNRAGVLPFTVVLDRRGKVAYAHAGVLTEDLLGAALIPLI